MPITDLLPWNRDSKKLPVRRERDRDLPVLRGEFERFIDEFFANPFSMRSLWDFFDRRSEFIPRVDVAESDKEIRVVAEMPGMDEKDLQVSLGRNYLTVSGEKRSELEEKGRRYYRLERSFGSFRRTIPLLAEIDEDRVEATFKKGVLTVVLPKSAAYQKQARQIKVKKA